MLGNSCRDIKMSDGLALLGRFLLHTLRLPVSARALHQVTHRASMLSCCCAERGVTGEQFWVLDHDFVELGMPGVTERVMCYPNLIGRPVAGLLGHRIARGFDIIIGVSWTGRCHKSPSHRSLMRCLSGVVSSRLLLLPGLRLLLVQLFFLGIDLGSVLALPLSPWSARLRWSWLGWRRGLAFSLGQLGLKLTDALSILAGGVVAFLPVLVGGCSSSCGVCSFGWGCALP
mmetsp:Transcript_29966/g.61673  ORF Transcript_29966/g.61673 Transcript_29966/m.61673 type:complete len:230 (+) Transcript_29966:126-815(+)